MANTLSLWSSEAAGWAQAIGTVVAIIASTLIAIFVPHRERRLTTRRAQEAALAAARHLIHMTYKWLVISADDQRLTLARSLPTAGMDLRDTGALLAQLNGPAIDSPEAIAELHRISSSAKNLGANVPIASGMSNALFGGVITLGAKLACEQYNAAALAIRAKTIDPDAVRRSAAKELDDMIAEGVAYVAKRPDVIGRLKF